MRNTGQKMIAQLMQEHNGCLIFMDMDNLKKINDMISTVIKPETVH